MDQQVIDLVKLRLNIKDISLDSIIESYVLEIKYKILNYCHIDLIPESLKFLWSTMVMDIVRVDQAYQELIADSNADNVKGMSLGDTSISYGSTGDVTSASKKSVESLVLNYAKELNTFRRLPR